MKTYPFLSDKFLDAMNEIGEYGLAKYGKRSFQARRLNGEILIRDDRTGPEVIADHAREHFAMYLASVHHDHFGTEIHQLAAVAFNAMMESEFAGLSEEAEEEHAD